MYFNFLPFFLFPFNSKTTYMHIIEGKCKKFPDKQGEKAKIWVGWVTINATSIDIKCFTGALFVSEKIINW